MDEQGVPRDWKPGDQIREIYATSKEECIKMSHYVDELVLQGNPETGIPNIREPLVKTAKMQQILSNFETYTLKEFNNAKNMMDRKNAGSQIIPTHPITWAVILYFAYDDLWNMLKNPLYLITFVLGFAIIALAYQAHTMGIGTFNFFFFVCVFFFEFFRLQSWIKK